MNALRGRGVNLIAVKDRPASRARIACCVASCALVSDGPCRGCPARARARRHAGARVRNFMGTDAGLPAIGDGGHVRNLRGGSDADRS